VPLLPQEAELGPVRDALSQLQMAYVQEAQGAEDTGQGAEEQAQAPETPPQPADDEAERAKARSKIWTPPGS
jgi:hypothetical protein